MSTFASLEAVSAPGTGRQRRLVKTTAHHTMIVTVEGTGSVTSIVQLEGSHDGIRWVPIGTNQLNGWGMPPEGGMVTGMTVTSPVSALMEYIRANAIRIESKGGTVHVTATIASADDA